MAGSTGTVESNANDLPIHGTGNRRASIFKSFIALSAVAHTEHKRNPILASQY